MLQSIFQKAKQPLPQGKQPAFDSQWGYNPELPAGLTPGQIAKQVVRQQKAELVEHILSSLRTSAYKNSNNVASTTEPAESSGQSFAGDLASQTQECVSHIKTLIGNANRAEELYSQARALLIDQCFDLLRGYAYEFNSALDFAELHVTCTKPAEITEVLRWSMYREPIETATHLRARFSTKHTSLIIRGAHNVVDFFFLPANKIIGLSKSESTYKACVQLIASFDGQGVEWQHMSQPVTPQLLEDICQDLFRELIQVSRAHCQSRS